MTRSFKTTYEGKLTMIKKQSVIVKMLVITIFMLMTSMSGVVFADEDESTNGN